MPVYFIARLNLIDNKAMQGYQQPTAASIKAFGGHYLASSDAITTLEGIADCERIVMLEFPTKQQAMDWYESDLYAPLLTQRKAATDSHFILVE